MNIDFLRKNIHKMVIKMNGVEREVMVNKMLMNLLKNLNGLLY